MNVDISASELFDRYVAEVGRNLPQRARRDVELEMRSLLEDALEDAVSTEQMMRMRDLTVVPHASRRPYRFWRSLDHQRVWLQLICL